MKYEQTQNFLEMQVHRLHPGLWSEDLWAWSQETALKAVKQMILCTVKLENPERYKELHTFMTDRHVY